MPMSGRCLGKQAICIGLENIGTSKVLYPITSVYFISDLLGMGSWELRF